MKIILINFFEKNYSFGNGFECQREKFYCKYTHFINSQCPFHYFILASYQKGFFNNCCNCMFRKNNRTLIFLNFDKNYLC